MGIMWWCMVGPLIMIKEQNMPGILQVSANIQDLAASDDDATSQVAAFHRGNVRLRAQPGHGPSRLPARLHCQRPVATIVARAVS